MLKKLAKIKYLPNNFEIIEEGDYVECSISSMTRAGIELAAFGHGCLRDSAV